MERDIHLLRKLRNIYYSLGILALVGFILLFILDKFNVELNLLQANRLFSISIMICASVTSIILPIWYKLILIKKRRRKGKVKYEDFSILQIQITISASLTLYWIFPAYLFNFVDIPLLITVFFALYALYYFYPSMKRIKFEKKIFGIDD